VVCCSWLNPLPSSSALIDVSSVAKGFQQRLMNIDRKTTYRYNSRSMIPAFRLDGYLPEGLHRADEIEVTFRFGSATPRRRRLVLRLRRWLDLARQIGVRRFLVDGSFVTAKPDPNDIDAVIFLPTDFQLQVQRDLDAALDLEQMLLTRSPEELFAAEDETDWNDWFEFFSRTREADGRRKGLVEIIL
jgi:hypothetical protein